jgi:hypothetical protein
MKLTHQPLTVTMDTWKWLMFMGWIQGLVPNGVEGMMDDVLRDIARQLAPALEDGGPG